jgi:hypothetical protein
VKWFGGIPMKGDARFSPGDEKKIPRSSVAEVYASIEADLILLKFSSYSCTKGKKLLRARLALGKAYLYQNKFGPAATTLIVYLRHLLTL